MTEQITLSQLYWNKGLASFCLRKQSQDTLAELVMRVGANESNDAFEQLEDAVEMTYATVGDFEESLYSASVDEILDELGYGY